MRTAVQIRRRLPLSKLSAIAALFIVTIVQQQGCAPDPAPPPPPPAVKIEKPAAKYSLTVNANQPGVKISPMLYGLMTEEINYSYDGGLYGELIQNRVFQNSTPPPSRPTRSARRSATAPTPAPAPVAAPTSRPDIPLHWSVVLSPGASGKIEADDTDPVNTTALKTSLRLDIDTVQANQRVGVANDGYWGIPVKPNTSYRASFYAKAGNWFSGPLTVSIESKDGSTVYATATTPTIDTDWHRYTVMLATDQITPTADARFIISAQSTGSVWFSLVSLFPPTFKDRPNGNRPDIMQLLADMHPAFLRFPGGNYLEGDTIDQRFDWKQTIHDLDQRPGHWSPWHYRSTDGLGLLEFLEWCQDINMEPILAVYAGYSLTGQQVTAGHDLAPYVQDALDEIEYVTGDASTPWGSQRAKDGHPEPFPLTYVEIGNEDFAGSARRTYEARFAQFHDAIKAKYPKLQLIATIPITSRKADVQDDHYYKSETWMEQNVHHYDSEKFRSGPKIFVGEWATREGSPTPNMHAALGDAVWLTGLERNSDLVVLACYAPLFVNVNRGGMQWATDLIGYNTLSSYGSPSYYVQKMFNTNRGDRVLPVLFSPPSLTGPTTQPIGGIYATASTDTNGQIILKVVNTHAIPQQLQINLNGVKAVDKKATAEVLTGEPGDVNSIKEPQKIVPQSVMITDAAPSFPHEFPAHSVSVIRLQTR
jgi:alpha-L-arabinofuranosidase